jgi:protoporphyrinogen oxidase
VNVILGAGLAGLSAGYLLSKTGQKVILVEKDHCVGGLAKTVKHRGFMFDLGGHRFLTKDPKIENFVTGLLQEESLIVPRKSRIYMMDRFFDYPLRPMNALFGLGIPTTLQILADYVGKSVIGRKNGSEVISLEDWVVRRFGRKLFELYFKEYSEKVWGTECKNISMEWVSRRIKGLSLWKAITNSFFGFNGKDIDTLADSFIYPKYGIGQIAETLKKGIGGNILTDTSVTAVYHEDCHIRCAVAKDSANFYELEGNNFVSSLPLTILLNLLDPPPPDDVLDAAGRLKYRDLVVVAVMLDRERVSGFTWIYFPEKAIPFGRLHEPRNWSRSMAPDGKTHLVAEFFVSEGDATWNSSDDELSNETVNQLEGIGFIRSKEVIDTCVVRVPKAYPVLEVGYRKHYKKVMDYLENFRNLSVIGRGGTFSYINMDLAIDSGIRAAEKILEMPKRKSGLVSISSRG